MLKDNQKIFCKFRGLDYDGNLIHFPKRSVTHKKNSYFFDILKNCRLYGASFNSLNDIDEGRFIAKSEKAIKKIRDEKIREGKKRFKICSFSLKEALEYDKQETDEFIQEILTSKKKCFEYECEYRAIWNEEEEYLPIKICAMTLGRRFTREPISNDETENREFDKNDEAVRIARQFLGIWQEGGHKGEQPKFYAYKTKYSKKPQEIPISLLWEMEG